MDNEFFILREGIADYLCRNIHPGCMIIAQRGPKKTWIKYNTPYLWRDLTLLIRYNPDWKNYLKDKILQTLEKEEVVAILLMGKNEIAL